MSHWTQFKRAYRVNKLLDQLEFAKMNAVRAHYGLPPIVPWYEKLYVKVMDKVRTHFMQICCPCVLWYRDRKRRMKTCCGRCGLSGTYENDVVKSFLGCFAGLITTVFVYLLMVWKMEYKPTTAAVLSSILGLVLSLGYAFYIPLRCYSLLIAPQFFSSRGRTFLIIYAFMLVMGYPVKNVAQNVVVLSESATCGQSLAYNQTKEFVEAALNPMAQLVGSIRKVLVGLQIFTHKIRDVFRAFRNVINDVAGAVDSGLQWLVDLVDVCNREMKEPYNKCMTAFRDAKASCDDIPIIPEFICDIIMIVSYVCEIARIGELLCLLADYLKQLILKKVGEPAKGAMYKVYDMFFVSVNVNYHYNFTTEQSQSYEQVRKAIMQDITSRVAVLDGVIDFLNNILGLTIFFVFIKALYYREKFMTDETFDNRYITKNLHKLDERRQKKGISSIFPLSGDEQLKYVKAWTLYLTLHERRKMLKGVVMYLSSVLYAGFYLVCDFGLYWMLAMIRRHSSAKVHKPVPTVLKLQVLGSGIIADMYRALISIYDPLTGLEGDLQNSPCIPKPSRPNYRVYQTIGTIYGVCLILTIFEAYALRMRHVVMGTYYPKLAQKRTTWLYNHIVKNRGGFLKMARRQLRRKYRNDTSVKKASIRGKLVAKFPFLSRLMQTFGYDQKSCLLCGAEGKQLDFVNFYHCSTGDCEAIYCTDCYTDINNMCTVCMNPVDYGDLSDDDEERDSSEDETAVEEKKQLAAKRRAMREAQIEANKPENLLGRFRGFAEGTVKFGKNTEESSSSDDEEDFNSSTTNLLS